jgi:hypothetical protein
MGFGQMLWRPVQSEGNGRFRSRIYASPHFTALHRTAPHLTSLRPPCKGLRNHKLVFTLPSRACQSSRPATRPKRVFDANPPASEHDLQNPAALSFLTLKASPCWILRLGLDFRTFSSRIPVLHSTVPRFLAPFCGGMERTPCLDAFRIIIAGPLGQGMESNRWVLIEIFNCRAATE